jgi:fructose-specific phosphotransferase system IIC component
MMLVIVIGAVLVAVSFKFGYDVGFDAGRYGRTASDYHGSHELRSEIIAMSRTS